MRALAVLAVILVAGLLWLLRGSGGSDAPARTVTVAAGLLPEHQREWGLAMATSAGASAVTRSRAAGARAGLLAVVLGARSRSCRSSTAAATSAEAGAKPSSRPPSRAANSSNSASAPPAMPQRSPRSLTSGVTTTALGRLSERTT
jgi:hypothetical protein